MAASLPPSKKQIDYGCLDRLSNLPKEVINEILERMPIHDAVKTNMLSTSWRYRWMSMSKLIFNKHSFSSSNVGGRTNANLLNYVNNILLLHNGMVSKFEVNNFLETGCADVDRWILFLSRTMLKDLVLVFNEPNGYQVPACLFDCGHLTTLTLQCCSLSLPSHYKGFNYLTTLVLEEIELTSETVEMLVVQCISLLSLKVFICTASSRLSINAPNLIHCVFAGLCDGIIFQNTPKLESADILIGQDSDFKLKPTCRLNEVLGGSVNICRISLYCPFMEVGAAPRLQITCYHLESVKLLVNLQDSKQILAILCLFRSAPNLEKIEISSCRDDSVILLFESNFWEGRIYKEDTLHRLKNVSMNDFEGVPHELGFVEFILLNALVLETLSIKWKVDVQINKKLSHVLRKMVQFKRASSEANVLFSG